MMLLDYIACEWARQYEEATGIKLEPPEELLAVNYDQLVKRDMCPVS
jgi:hypothetical protein